MNGWPRDVLTVLLALGWFFSLREARRLREVAERAIRLSKTAQESYLELIDLVSSGSSDEVIDESIVRSIERMKEDW